MDQELRLAPLLLLVVPAPPDRRWNDSPVNLREIADVREVPRVRKLGMAIGERPRSLQGDGGVHVGDEMNHRGLPVVVRRVTSMQHVQHDRARAEVEWNVFSEDAPCGERNVAFHAAILDVPVPRIDFREAL
jgi:hypothetical protein